MTKPEDIPQETLRAASVAVFQFECEVQAGKFANPEGNEASAALTNIVARAILAATEAEREACAREAQTYLQDYLSTADGPYRALAKLVPAAIRTPTHP